MNSTVPALVVADGCAGLDRRGADRLLDAVRQIGCRRLLDQLLVAALRRAVACRHPDEIAVVVADDLHLDVAGPREIALDVHLVAAEERLSLALRAGHRFVDLAGAVDDLHASAAAAERRLDRHRPAVLLAECSDLVGVRGELGRARNDRRAAAQRRLAARHLVAHRLDRVRRRSDERDAEVDDRPGEVGVLGEEPVAGVHAVGTAAGDRVEDRRRC